MSITTVVTRTRPSIIITSRFYICHPKTEDSCTVLNDKVSTDPDVTQKLTRPFCHLADHDLILLNFCIFRCGHCSLCEMDPR